MSTDSKRGGTATMLGTVGLLFLAAVCCSAPLLITAGSAGVLGGVGSVLGNPWIVAVSVAVVVGVVVVLFRRWVRRNDNPDACQIPGAAAKTDGAAEPGRMKRQ